MKTRSHIVAFLLVALFGPLGSFYGGFAYGFIALSATIVLGVLYPPLILAGWLLSFAAVHLGVSSHNRQRLELIGGLG